MNSPGLETSIPNQNAPIMVTVDCNNPITKNNPILPK